MKKRPASSRGQRAKRTASASKPPPSPAADNLPVKRVGAVTLWGEILEESDGYLRMAVNNHGDARTIGVCGLHWIAKRQMFGKPGRQDGYDYVRVSFAYASQLAQSSQMCE